MYRTQKARGIAELRAAADALRPDIYVSPNTQIIQSTEQLEAYISNGSFMWPRFARPCPVTPRHGFVESREVQTPEELRAVWQETLAADPQGELVVMPVLKAVASAVITDSSVSVGPGNDGATSGHDSHTFPVAHVRNLDCDVIKAVVTDSVFAEIVSVKLATDFTHYLVQLRDGPKQSHHIGDWIPEDITVQHILAAHGDLLEFEKLAKQAPPGTVVHSPGGNLLSHYSIHAQLNKLPIVFSQDCPRFGQKLDKTVTVVQPDYDIATIKQGIAAGFHSPNTFDEVRQGLKTCLVALHQGAGTWRIGRPAFIFGYGIGALMLAGTLASMGEGRYFARRILPHGCSHRNEAYGDFLKHRVAARRLLPDVVKLFKQQWRWEPQMGGYAWARCTRQLIKLDTIIQTLDTQDRVIELISAVNTLVNFAHNTGRYLNKFLSGEDFDFAESGRLAPILSALMSDGLQAEPVKYAYPYGILPPKLNAGHGRIAQNRTVAYVSTRGLFGLLFGLGTDDGVVRIAAEVPQDCITELGTCDGDVSKMLAILRPRIANRSYRWLRDFHINLGMYDFYGYTQGNWSVRL